MKPAAHPISISALRSRAEHALLMRAESDPNRAGNEYELRLHQLELQMQNEAMRELQLELSIAKERYRDLFDRAPLAYLVLDDRAQVVEANLCAAALLHRPVEQLKTKKISTFIDPACAQRFALHMRAVLESDRPQRCELSLALAEDGGSREVRLDSARDLQYPRQWRVAITDITELCEIRRSAERAQRLEAVGAFASGIAHDFSNLLAIVAGGADFALEQLDHASHVRLPLERMKRATVQGKAMIHQLLRFAAGPETDSSSVFELDVAVKAAEQTVRQFSGSDVNVSLRLGASGALVSLDLGGPEEILTNLAANAQQAMPHGGELKIETRTVIVPNDRDQRLQRSYAVLSVSDTGAGMDEQTQLRAFDPFFTTKKAGTGLGLSMVHGIVKRAGGHIQLTSKSGSGTTFRIFLPLSS